MVAELSHRKKMTRLFMKFRKNCFCNRNAILNGFTFSFLFFFFTSNCFLFVCLFFVNFFVLSISFFFFAFLFFTVVV